MFPFLRFSPDEGGGAAPPAVAPPELAPVPGEEQEQPPPVEEEGASGAPPEDEGEGEPEASLADRIKAYLDELETVDPEKAKAEREQMGLGQPDVSDERFTWELEQAQQERGQEFGQAVANWSQYGGSQQNATDPTPTAAYYALVNQIDGINQLFQHEIERFKDGKRESLDGLAVDAQREAEKLLPFIQGTQIAWGELQRTGNRVLVRTALEGHSSYRHLSADERKQQKQLLQAGRAQDAITMQLDAALKAAPEHIKKQAEQEAAKKTGLLKERAKIEELLGRNGKRTSLTGGPAAARKRYNDMTPEERAALTPDQRDQIIAQERGR